LRSIALLKQLLKAEGLPPAGGRRSLFAQVDTLRLHQVDAVAELARLPGASN
jgi:hypothetical protein